MDGTVLISGIAECENTGTVFELSQERGHRGKGGGEPADMTAMDAQKTDRDMVLQCTSKALLG